jgi:hypothetical protein
MGQSLGGGSLFLGEKRRSRREGVKKDTQSYQEMLVRVNRK